MEHGSADGKNGWVIDKRGRHANMTALYDWPEYEDNDDVASFLASSTLGTYHFQAFDLLGRDSASGLCR